tara:strand:- start:64 stop:795 length:732 start_codon:yes stop_codon:yes gene_type:complete
MLERFYNDENKYEISIDEAGRGCLFGRVYVASVILPKEPALFDGTNIKDSKKFSSKKKINEVAEYIKKNALVYHIEYVEADMIDKINILKSVMYGMHQCIKTITTKVTENIDNNSSIHDFQAVIDGNYFTPYMCFDQTTESIETMNHVTVEQGDAKYMGIAAASILAKTARDAYVLELCEEYPQLNELYGLAKNVGYGTKQHREGICAYGITQWHRKTFGENCRNAKIISIEKKQDDDDNSSD